MPKRITLEFSDEAAAALDMLLDVRDLDFVCLILEEGLLPACENIGLPRGEDDDEDHDSRVEAVTIEAALDEPGAIIEL